MTSVVGLCNLALAHLGDRATLSSIDPPEGSAQADHCATFWPIARDNALASRDWLFASTSAALPLYDDSVDVGPTWRHAYAPPSDMIAARAFVFDEGELLFADHSIPRYELGLLPDGRKALFADYDNLVLRYTKQVNEPTLYPPIFALAVSYLLASYLAGPIVKGKAGVSVAQAMWQRWEMEAGKAAAADHRQQHNPQPFVPAGVRARGAAAYGRTLEDGPYRRELPFWAES